MSYRTSTRSNGDGTETTATRWVGWTPWDTVATVLWLAYIVGSLALLSRCGN